MKQTALILNLQAHYAGLNEKKLLFSCGDCEGHIGNDQRIYLCDFAVIFLNYFKYSINSFLANFSS